MLSAARLSLQSRNRAIRSSDRGSLTWERIYERLQSRNRAIRSSDLIHGFGVGLLDLLQSRNRAIRSSDTTSQKIALPTFSGCNPVIGQFGLLTFL